MIAIKGLVSVSVYLSLEIKIVDYPIDLNVSTTCIFFQNYFTIITVNKVETNLMD